MIRQIQARLWWRRFLARNARPWQELEEFPALPPDQQRHLLAQQLLAQIQYFGNRGDALPEWRDAARLTDPDKLWRIWPSLPIVNKRLLQTHFHPRDMQPRFSLPGKPSSTGGSTGEPTPFLHDPLMERSTMAQATYTRIRTGWRAGMATVIVWGSERDIGSSTHWRTRLNNKLLRDYLVDGYNLTEQTMHRTLHLIRRHRPVAIYGFTSMLEFIAQKTLERNLCPSAGSVRTAFCGGEMLFPEQIEVFRRAFGVPILNRYGGRELSVMACQFREKDVLHVLRPWLIVEVVDDNGRSVAPGETGRLLWTSTVCRGTPFLRYDIEDCGAFDTAHQTEAGITALKELHGRFAGLLQLPNGKKISSLFWNHLFKEFAEVRQFQVVLQPAGIQLRLKGTGFATEQEAHLRHTVSQFLGDVPLAVSWVETIPRTPQGKLMQVVRERAEE
jgi:phenylacetate-CoA ligase